MKFGSFEEFLEWKKNIEESTITSYIFDHGNKNRNIRHWKCHRNGDFVPLNPRERQVAVKGSKKINAYRPSKIQYRNSDCTAEYIPTHVGHCTGQRELVHIRFSETVYDEVAAKLRGEVPIRRIIKDVRECSANNEMLSCKEIMLTRQDVYNIGASRNISNINIRNQRRCPDDVEGVDSWVKENSDSVLFYKKQDLLQLNVSLKTEDLVVITVDSKKAPEKQGESGGEIILKKEDFVLVIMCGKQVAKFHEFGTDIVCLDATHGTNPYDFHLHTFLVVDEKEEGYPIAFMITNRNDKYVVKIMLQAMKERLSQVIMTRVLMMDMQRGM